MNDAAALYARCYTCVLEVVLTWLFNRVKESSLECGPAKLLVGIKVRSLRSFYSHGKRSTSATFRVTVPHPELQLLNLCQSLHSLECCRTLVCTGIDESRIFYLPALPSQNLV